MCTLIGVNVGGMYLHKYILTCANDTCQSAFPVYVAPGHEI